jgi:hypothetical protein
VWWGGEEGRFGRGEGSVGGEGPKAGSSHAGARPRLRHARARRGSRPDSTLGRLLTQSPGAATLPAGTAACLRPEFRRHQSQLPDQPTAGRQNQTAQGLSAWAHQLLVSRTSTCADSCACQCTTLPLKLARATRGQLLRWLPACCTRARTQTQPHAHSTHPFARLPVRPRDDGPKAAESDDLILLVALGKVCLGRLGRGEGGGGSQRAAKHSHGAWHGRWCSCAGLGRAAPAQLRRCDSICDFRDSMRRKQAGSASLKRHKTPTSRPSQIAIL